MSANKTIAKRLLFAAIGLAVVISILHVQRIYPVFSYLFLSRVPLSLGILLVMLPILGLRLLPGMLKGLFSLQSGYQVFVIVFLAFMNALMVVVTSLTITLYANKRFEGLDKLAEDIYPDRWFLGLILAIPIIWGVAKTSVETSWRQRIVGIVLGSVCAAGIILASVWALKKNIMSEVLVKVIDVFNCVTQDSMVNGYVSANGTLHTGHTFAMMLVVVLAVIYIIGYWLFKPAPDKKKPRPPTLYYVLLLLLFSGYLLSGITFYLDNYRVPVMLTLFILVVVSYNLWKVDHYYKISDSTHPPSEADRHTSVKENLILALENRFKLFQEDENRTLVVVSCMGGGIQASGWTTQVLGGLQSELGEKFTQAIGIVSSVSGGSVGTMHYLDHFDNKKGALKPASLQRAVDVPLIKVSADSVAESLFATGWGLAYPDYLRTIGLPLLVPKEIDRGWAIEQAWKANLNFPDTTFTKWRELILQGEFPLPIFNSIIVETGQRFMLAPMPFSWEGVDDRMKVDFHQRYPGKDLEVVTAARLSATFPYVTPVCRTNLSNDTPYASRHIADGGYFDNFGVFTTLEWLKEVILPIKDKLKISRLLMIELNGFLDAGDDQGENRPNGFIAGLAGPILAVLNTRTSTQVARNEAEVESLLGNWNNKLDIKRVQIQFKAEKSGEKPPLSWKLTYEQKKDIAEAWDILKREENGALDEIRTFWNRHG